MTEIRFTYLGPSADTKPLASGEIRRRIGLKLRSQNQCNLLYVMWHIEPDARLAVLVKRNPGESTHTQCGAHGYTTVRPRAGTTPPRIKPSESHALRAALNGNDLTVTADRTVVWTGTIGDDLAGIDGPAGLRTDNARFEFRYYASPLVAAAGSGRCEISAED